MNGAEVQMPPVQTTNKQAQKVDNKSLAVARRISEPAIQCWEHLNRLAIFIHLAVNGIETLTMGPQILAKLWEVRGIPEDDRTEWQIQELEKVAVDAQREVSTGFAMLYELVLVSAWGNLEDFVRAFLAKWLECSPDAIMADKVQSLRISVGDYESLEREERCEYIVELLEKDIKAPLRHGITRYEDLLRVFGLSGSVDDTVKKALFEMGHLRNVIVHRRSIVDQRLCNACPWLNYAPGDPLVMSRIDNLRYREAVSAYRVDIMRRAFVRLEVDKTIQVPSGMSLEEFMKEVMDSLRRMLPEAHNPAAN